MSVMADHIVEATEVMEVEVLPHLPSGRLTNRSLRRADVVTAFSAAFQMIGGVPRMALWADQNPGEFYKLYARLLPSQASDDLDSADGLRIIHALPPPARIAESQVRDGDRGVAPTSSPPTKRDT